MNYVEWLRVRNALRIYAIVLGALIVIALIVRISVAGKLSSNEWIVSHIQNEPGTVVTHSIVDGLNRTTLYNAKERTTITIDDKNDGGKLIHVEEPASKSTTTSHNVNIYSMQVAQSQANGMESITFNSNGPINVAIYLVIACVAGLVFATIWGGAFACELGHLEYAVLKPVTRTRYGLGIMGYDLLGMVLAGAMTIVTAVICTAFFEIPHFDFSHVFDPVILLVLVIPVAWYALLNAATSSMRRGTGAIIGFAWPIAFILISLSHIPSGDLPAMQVFHAIVLTISRLIPITYLPNFNDNGSVETDVLSITTKLAIVTGLMLIYGALTLVQWRRVEA
jgi:hypothetical protein